jgi:PAS domain S-box-containing protein
MGHGSHLHWCVWGKDNTLSGPSQGMREKGVDETSKGSWAGGLPPPRGTGARFESQVSGGSSTPGSETSSANPHSDAGSALDIVFIVKQDGSILYLNRTLKGGPDAAPGESSVFNYTNEEYHGALRTALDDVFATGEAHGYECMGVDPFKEGAWFQCRVAPNRREGKVVSATIIARDITAWKRAEQGLRQERDQLKSEFDSVRGELERLRSRVSEEGQTPALDRFRSLIDQAGEAIFITDPETGRFVDVNETACRWVGQTREKLLTMGINDLDLEFPLESPNGVPEHVTNTRNSHRPKIYSGGCHRRRDGTSFPVEVAIARRAFGGRQYQLVVARDIKERRKATEALREVEDRFRSLFELSRDAIYLSARDGSVAEVNDAAIDLFGYTRAEFLRMEARRLYLKPEDIRTFQRGVDQSGSVRNMEVGLRKKDGATFTGVLSATLRHDGEGNILGYQCMIRPLQDNGTSQAQAAPSETRAPQVVEQPAKPTKDGVLVVDSDKRVLTEVREVLERAGIAVLTARTTAAGIEVFRAEESAVGVVLLGDSDKEAEIAEALRKLESIDPDVKVILLSEGYGRPGAAPHVDLEDIEVVRKPVHPLALVQHVREGLAARHSK